MDEENVKKVVEVDTDFTESVSQPQPKGLLSRLFISATRTLDLDKMGNDLMDKVIEPNIRSLVWKIIESIGQGILFQKPITDDPSSPISYSRKTSGRVNYNERYRYKSPAVQEVQVGSSLYSTTYSGPINFAFDFREDAYHVLDETSRTLRAYGKIKVSDMYDLCGLQAPDPIANKFGWTSNDSFFVQYEHDNAKWVLEVPRPKAL